MSEDRKKLVEALVALVDIIDKGTWCDANGNDLKNDARYLLIKQVIEPPPLDP